MTQLLFDFMPCKTEKELLIIQSIWNKLCEYDKVHLDDDTWFRKNWVNEDIRRRYLY
jgi:hypothetical protein